jgi:hypothetical protein
MKRQLRIALVALSCAVATSGIAAAENLFSPPGPQFTNALVSGKIMVSSGYPTGSMTFNSNGSLDLQQLPRFCQLQALGGATGRRAAQRVYRQPYRHHGGG